MLKGGGRFCMCTGTKPTVHMLIHVIQLSRGAHSRSEYMVGLQ